MATLEDVARAALGEIDSKAGLLLVCAWANERLKEISARFHLRYLRREGQVYCPAALSAGTIAITTGTSLVTGDATAYATWTDDLVGRHILINDVWFQITGQTSTTLTIDSKYADSTETAASYLIQKRFHALGDDVRHLGTFRLQRQNRELEPISLIELDTIAPRRDSHTGGPYFVTEVGGDEAGRRLVEFYPYSSDAEVVSYYYYMTAPDLHPTDPLPHPIDVSVLKSGVLINLYRFEMMQALKRGDAMAAGVLRNELRTQQTEWDQRLQEVRKVATGIDDVVWMVKPNGPGFRQSSSTIRSAYDYVWNR